MMSERNLYSKGIHDDDGNKNVQVKTLFFVTVYNEKLSNVTFYVMEDVSTPTTNFLSRFRLHFIIYIDKLSEAK